MTVVAFPARAREYVAKPFESGPYRMSGTLCGAIDITDGHLTHCLTPDEIGDLIIVLHAVRADVLTNSRPFTDPRIVG
jgi:hypothetical protein